VFKRDDNVIDRLLHGLERIENGGAVELCYHG
jgi:hypothetical protein